MIRDIISGQDAVTRAARSALKIAEKADDQPTVDILVQRLQIHEKNAWMLRSLIDNSASAPAPAPAPAPKAKSKKK